MKILLALTLPVLLCFGSVTMAATSKSCNAISQLYVYNLQTNRHFAKQRERAVNAAVGSMVVPDAPVRCENVSVRFNGASVCTASQCGVMVRTNSFLVIERLKTADGGWATLAMEYKVIHTGDEEDAYHLKVTNEFHFAVPSIR